MEGSTGGKASNKSLSKVGHILKEQALTAASVDGFNKNRAEVKPILKATDS